MRPIVREPGEEDGKLVIYRIEAFGVRVQYERAMPTCNGFCLAEKVAGSWLVWVGKYCFVFCYGKRGEY